MKPLSIIVAGWRFVPHSYAIVNQFQCLELLNRPHVHLFMRELRVWNERWSRVWGLMPSDQEDAIAALRAPDPDADVDVVLRLGVPVQLRPADKGRTFVLATADFGWLPRAMIANRQSLREAHANTDVVLITPSEWSKWGLIRAGADSDRIALVPHGVDTSIFYPAGPAEREPLRAQRKWQDKFVFLNVSAQSRSKGIDLILKAFARVAVRHPHAWLVLKGSDQIYSSRRWLNRWWREQLTAAERRACAGRIEYIGTSMPFAQLAGIFRAADVYVTPYRSESFNLPALEAIASGLPIICTAGGPTDAYTIAEFARRIDAKLVPGTRAPEVVREPNLDDLTEAMLAMIEAGTPLPGARKLGPAYVAGGFTWRHAVDKLLDAVTRS